jgi:TolC family type I secretion outer membrane protein
MAINPAANALQNLTLAQSISLAVNNNLDIKLAAAQTEEAKSAVMQSVAALLPHLRGTMSQTRTFRENLDAQGFAGYGYIGPFDTFDARLTLVQDILNWNSYAKLQSSEQKKNSALLKQQLAAEQVSASAALAYMDVLRSAASLYSVQADEKLAREMLALSQERHSAGTATGLDVAREKTRVAQARSKVLNAQVIFDDAGLRLRHVIGIPLDEDVRLADKLDTGTTSFPEESIAVACALNDRLELEIGRLEVSAAQYSEMEAKSGHLPTLSATGELALSGIKPDSGTGSVGDIGVQLRLPLFEGGAVSAQVREAGAVKAGASAKLADMRVQVEQDVRLALKQLNAAVEQVATAQEALELAQSELDMAQDRFSAGIGDNVELVNAQTSLSEARAERVNALAQYNNARINLALALGHMRTFSLR